MARKVRLTKFGFYVCAAGLGVLVLILVLVICLVSCNAKKNTSNAEATAEPTSEVTEGEDTESTDTELSDTEADTEDESGYATPTPVAEPTAEPTPSPTPTPDNSVARTPTPDEVESAKDAQLNNSGVVLRNAPNTSGSIIKKYAKGTMLKVYAESGDYYLVQVVKDSNYGYMAKKFISYVSITPTPSPTPTPVPIPEGAVKGTVSKSKVALRKSPDLSDSTNKFGELTQGATVYIYYSYTNANGDPFYYIQVADPNNSQYGKYAYVYKTYITASGSVPAGTPAP